ncbi:hypothetical protein EYF80_003704 [Liparis tanakae]|uniref:Uncharacterized protein n=1 Tax=Liparis tanakae TaxID=230148 RepID=A0A4Z2J6U0_9TELE|nr:hypothetical protein EYF80_003704 [Liparis tanakae]
MDPGHRKLRAMHSGTCRDCSAFSLNRAFTPRCVLDAGRRAEEPMKTTIGSPLPIQEAPQLERHYSAFITDIFIHSGLRLPLSISGWI